MYKDSFVDVLNLRSTDNVLVVGEEKIPNYFVPIVENAKGVKKRVDLSNLYLSDAKFDKAVVTADSASLVLQVCQLIKKGLVGIVVRDDKTKEDVLNLLTNYHSYASIWELDSDLGKMLVTNAHGEPQY